MTKTISTIATALALSLAIQGCTQKNDSSEKAECVTSEDDAMGEAQQSMDDAKHAASKAALEAHNAANAHKPRF